MRDELSSEMFCQITVMKGSLRKLSSQNIRGCVVRGSRKISAPFPVTMATPKAGAPPEPAQPWLTERE